LALLGGVPYNVVNSVELRDHLITLAKVETDTKGTEKAKSFDKYSTAIDDKVKVIEKVDLPDWIRESFTDGIYRTVITVENIMVYRTFGGGAKVNGSFATTSPAGNRISAKINTL
jgi:toxin YxiD